MTEMELPDLSRDVLVDLGGWAVLKEGRGMFEGAAVQSVRWEAPVLFGEVKSGATSFFPRLNLKSLIFAENRCNCPEGRRGQVCAHAIAVCLHAQQNGIGEPKEEAWEEPDLSPAPQPEPEPEVTVIKTTPSGTELRLRFLLPPNIAQSAPRDAIMTKLEFAVGRELTPPERLFRGKAYTVPPGHLKALALLEQWCRGMPGSLLQLKRSQLRELLGAMVSEPFFYYVNQPGKPLEWLGETIPAIHPHLSEAPSENASQPSSKTSVRRSGNVEPARKRISAVDLMKEKIRREGVALSRMQIDGSTQFLAITLPSRDAPNYEYAVQLLKDNGFRLEPSNRRWWLRDRHKTLNFLAEHENALREEYEAEFTDNFVQRTRKLKRVGFQVQTVAQSGGFQLNLRMEAGSLEPGAIHRALATGRHYVESGSEIFLFDPTRLEQLQQAQQALSGDKSRVLTPEFKGQIRNAQLADAEGILAELDDDFEIPVDWQSRSGALKRLDRLERPPVAKELDQLLRNYQRIGVAWLWHLCRHELGGILADEMGLGKTVQALGLLQCAHDRWPELPCLVVAPASLLGNWAREASRFAPGLRVFVHHRESRLEAAEAVSEYDLVVTSYPTMARDDELLSAIDWSLIVADEAQHIKNRRTQSARALRRLPARSRFVLTGTPVENSLDDLRSIFAFILPGYLARMPDGASGEDRSWYDQRHRQQAATYILRRTKQLVAPELPPKIEQVIYCEMGKAQHDLYAKVRESTERAIFEMEMAGKSENQVRMAALTQLLRLRQVCAEPRLINDQLTPADSAKIEAFNEILEEALDDGHRLLVFSQFVSVLKHLQAHLESLGVRFLYLDGSTRDRLALCDRFNSDPSITVFLISLKAGGVGLNLTGADTVVHFDPWWNPAVEDQATDRAHRIGQTRTVTSYKLIAANTVEERVVELQRNKAAILRDLLDESASANAKVSLADIKALIEG